MPPLPNDAPSSAMDAEAAVLALLAAQLGLANPTGPRVRGFRDLFQLPSLVLYAQKTRLLAAAERTGCAAVILEVLLFLSQTMAREGFYRELAHAPVARQLWLRHELDERLLPAHDGAAPAAATTSGAVAIEAQVATILQTLLVTHSRANEIATTLLALVFPPSATTAATATATAPPLLATVGLTKEVLRAARRTRPYRLPPWLLERLDEFVALSELQLLTETEDAHAAPPVTCLEGTFDKRARGANAVNANWRLRFFRLTATELVYYKHDAMRMAQSRNPFLDRREKGVIRLTRGLPVTTLQYSGKVSRRPHCLQLGDGPEALILDLFTPVVQETWRRALADNIRRLELDPRWLRFPRATVHRQGLQQFLLYALVYHHDKDPEAVDAHPVNLQRRFHLDPRRVAFASLVAFARLEDWERLEAMLTSSSSSTAGHGAWWALGGGAHGKSPTPELQEIGYGAILEILETHHAPLGLIGRVEELLRHTGDPKKPTWSRRPVAITA